MRALHALCLTGALAASSAAAVAQPLVGDPCDIMPWQSVENGMGAETGVVREFAARITVPPGCLRGGRAWITQVRLGVTRTGGGAPDMNVRVALRHAVTALQGPLLPGPLGTPQESYILDNVPLFPNQGVYELGVGPNASGNLNDGLCGSEFFTTVDFDGDLSANQFLVADQVGPLDTRCYTGVNGAVPADLCSNGNPNLSAAALGANAYTFYGRYLPSGESVQGREPLGTTWAARYLRPPGGQDVDLRVWRDPLGAPLGDETICEFLAIPQDFSFQCAMTAPQLEALGAGQVMVELTGGGPTRSFRMIPADLFLFADGFESGDTGSWDVTVQ